MLESLSIIVNDSTPNTDEVVVALDVSEVFSRMRFHGTRYFLSPLQHACSSPKLVRSFHANQVDSSPYKKWNRMIDDVIRSAYDLCIQYYGLDAAEKYQIDANDFKHKMLAARGPIGFFEKGDGLCWIESEEQTNVDNQKEIIDILVFLIDIEQNKSLRIAKRNNRVFSLNNNNETPKGYDGMNSMDVRFEKLLESLTEFESSWSHQSSRTHHHLFCWGNSDIENFSESFIKESVKLYLDFVEDSYMFSSTGIILAKVSDNLVDVKLNNIESLSMKRIRPGSSFLVGDKKKKLPKSRIAHFFSFIGLDIKYLMKTCSSFSYHECQHRNENEFEVCILFPIWAGMWKESIDIDGEQVIFEN